MKIKVAKASPEEFAAVVYQATTKLESATLGQLQKSLVDLAESFIALSADCPNLETKRGLAMALVAQTLDENVAAPCLPGTIEAMMPITSTTN